MTELNERVLDRAASKELLRVEGLIALVERHDGDVDDGPGVPVERLRAYVEEIAREGGSLTPDNLDAALEKRSTDAETWAGQNLIYEVDDDRVSTYPVEWYERLEGVSDVEEHLRVIVDDIVENDRFEDSEGAFDQGGPGKGVPAGFLLDVASSIGDLSREEADAQLTELRKNDVVSEAADQYPTARVRLLDDDATGGESAR